MWSKCLNLKTFGTSAYKCGCWSNGHEHVSTCNQMLRPLTALNAQFETVFFPYFWLCVMLMRDDNLNLWLCVKKPTHLLFKPFFARGNSLFQREVELRGCRKYKIENDYFELCKATLEESKENRRNWKWVWKIQLKCFFSEKERKRKIIRIVNGYYKSRAG